jgi:hypothetical protein
MDIPAFFSLLKQKPPAVECCLSQTMESSYDVALLVAVQRFSDRLGSFMPGIMQT